MIINNNLIVKYFICIFIISVIHSCSKDKGSDIPVLKEITSFGVPGRGAGEFWWNTSSDEYPIIAHDGTYLHVVDEINNRVQRFDKDFKFKDWIGFKNNIWGTYTENIKGEDKFIPYRIIERNSNIYIYSLFEDESEILKIDSNAIIINKISVDGYKTFNVDDDENYYFFKNHFLEKYDKNGTFVEKHFYEELSDTNLLSHYLKNFYIDNNNNIYILDRNNKTVNIIDNKGNVINKWPADIKYSQYSFDNEYLYIIEDYHGYINDDEGFGYISKFDLNGEIFKKWIAPRFYFGFFIIEGSFLYEAYEEKIYVYSLD